MTNEELELKAEERELVIKEINVLKAKLAQIDQEIQHELDTRKEDHVETTCYNIYWKLSSSKRFDSTAFKKAYPKLVEAFSVDKVTTYFKCSLKSIAK